LLFAGAVDLVEYEDCCDEYTVVWNNVMDSVPWTRELWIYCNVPLGLVKSNVHVVNLYYSCPSQRIYPWDDNVVISFKLFGSSSSSMDVNMLIMSCV